MKVMKHVQMNVPKMEYLRDVPTPPVYLSGPAKKHYKLMAEKLIEMKRLKTIFLDALTIFAEAMAQFEWATREINRKNKESYGAGYVQVYASQATNISTEVVLRNNAEKTLLKCFSQFGLDPKSEKDLKATENPNQTTLLEEFMKQTS